MKRLLLLLVLAACAESPVPAYYLLTAPEAQPAAPATGPVLGLREIALPLYARRPQMAALGPGDAITLADFHRWAEDPPRAITRLIARSLAGTTARGIAVEPWSADISPRVLVQIETDRLIGRLGGTLRFDGQVRIIDRQTDAVRIEPFALQQPVGPTHADLAEAHSRAIVALAALIAATLAQSTGS